MTHLWLLPPLRVSTVTVCEPVKWCWVGRAPSPHQLADWSELYLMIIEAAAVPRTAHNSFLFNKSRGPITLPLPSVTLVTLTNH